MKNISVLLSVSLLLILFMFQNCSGISDKSMGVGSGSGVASLNLASHNYFTVTPPESMCGEDGYNFLMDQYIVKHCGACHDNPPIVEPSFAADTDRALSYLGQSLVTRERWIASSTNNKFCGDNCNLDPRGEVYKGLLEWLDCR